MQQLIDSFIKLCKSYKKPIHSICWGIELAIALIALIMSLVASGLSIPLCVIITLVMGVLSIWLFVMGLKLGNVSGALFLTAGMSFCLSQPVVRESLMSTCAAFFFVIASIFVIAADMKPKNDTSNETSNQHKKS